MMQSRNTENYSNTYDAMGCKDDVLAQEQYIGWLSELREYKEKERQEEGKK